MSGNRRDIQAQITRTCPYILSGVISTEFNLVQLRKRPRHLFTQDVRPVPPWSLIMRFSLTSALVLLSFSAAAVAQNKFCIGGELDSLTPAQISVCKEKSVSLRKEARLVGTPDNWHFVVICDEAGWNDYATFTGNNRKAILNATENTDSDLRFTFVRASRITSENSQSLDLVLASAKKNMPAGTQIKQLPAAKPAPARSQSLMALVNTPVPDSQ